MPHKLIKFPKTPLGFSILIGTICWISIILFDAIRMAQRWYLEKEYAHDSFLGATVFSLPVISCVGLTFAAAWIISTLWFTNFHGVSESDRDSSSSNSAGPTADSSSKSLQDIPNRIEYLEQALQESQELHEVLAENALTGIFIHQAGVFEYANKKLANIFGYSVEELLEKNFWEVVHPDDREMVKTGGIARAEGRSVIPRHYECRCIHKKGHTIWVEVYASSINYRGRPVAMGYIYDITAKKKSELAFSQSEERYRNILENIVEGYYEVDLKGNMTFLNSSMTRILRYDHDELMGLNYREYMDEANSEKVFKTFNTVYKTGQSTEAFGWELITKAGELRHVEVSVSLLRNSSGEPIGFRGICMDVTDRKQGEELLLQTERYKAVADLASGVAHNFNNLLQIVMAATRLAISNINKGNSVQSLETMEQILESLRMGAETVERLQAFAGLGPDAKNAEIMVFDLTVIVRQAIEMSKPWWKTKPEREGVRVELEAKLQKGCFIEGKKSELFEVVVNLIKNAAEALQDGGFIKVETTVLQDAVILKVRDTGVGISDDDLKRIFNPFFSTKMTTGTGMGLSTSRKIVNDHNGQILVSSSCGKGAEFTVTLPLAKAEPIDTDEQLSHEAFPLTLNILTVDDVEQLTLLIKDGLTESGAHVFTASSGEEAMEVFRSTPLDAIVCDLAMPGMNGWEVARRIKQGSLEKGRQKPVFILLTGWGNQIGDNDKMTVSGVDAIIQKPVDIPALKEVITRMVHDRKNVLVQRA